VIFKEEDDDGRGRVTEEEQEGWLSPTERASVSAVSLRHIIWLPHESHAGMSLPLAVCGCRHLATLREPKAHFGFPWVVYAPGTIAVNVTWIEREFNACQSHRSMYSSIFNRFPVIQPITSKFAILAHFLHIFASPGYVPGTIAINVTWIEREFNV